MFGVSGFVKTVLCVCDFLGSDVVLFKTSETSSSSLASSDASGGEGGCQDWMTGARSLNTHAACLALGEYASSILGKAPA